MPGASDDKLSNLPVLVNPTGRDLLYIVNIASSNSSSNSSRCIALKDFFGNVSTNTAINEDLTVSGNSTLTIVKANTFIVADQITPANSTSVTGIANGRIWSDNNYLYRNFNGTIKRIPWETF